MLWIFIQWFIQNVRWEWIIMRNAMRLNARFIPEVDIYLYKDISQVFYAKKQPIRFIMLYINFLLELVHFVREWIVDNSSQAHEGNAIHNWPHVIHTRLSVRTGSDRSGFRPGRVRSADNERNNNIIDRTNWITYVFLTNVRTTT